ncbi:hypothetical protein ACF1GW_38760 [Streptomyces achromogenes]|uniref:hypothetical protein n=1 Tax=Streptomyces achromogenes TaxID=67255 RepID=UPI0036FAF35C
MTDINQLLDQAEQLIRPADLSSAQLHKADTLARIATARALNAIAQDTTHTPTQAWAAGVTARLLTRAAILTGNRNATVDIHDTPQRSTALCQPCGWTKDHGITYRAQVLEWAQEHADQCTALAKPTT